MYFSFAILDGLREVFELNTMHSVIYQSQCTTPHEGQGNASDICNNLFSYEQDFPHWNAQHTLF